MRRPTALLVIFMALIARAIVADVQETAVLEGRILDPNGDPISGVTVSLTGARGDRTDPTGPNGAYRFTALVPGEYEVSVSLDGSPRTSATTWIGGGETSRLDLRLALGTTDVVDVIVQPPGINPLEAGVSSSLHASTAKEITSTSRNFQSLFSTFPSTVQSPGSQALGGHRVSVGGNHWQETPGYVDGVDTSNTRAGGSTRIFIPTTALAEIRLDSAGYDVSYGRSAGAVFSAVIKSGKNRLQGSAVLIPQSESWRAQSKAVPLKRSDEIKNSYELALGGPIVRDRLWFFAAVAENTTNEIDALRDGTVLDNSMRQQSRILKLTAWSGKKHSFSLTAIDAPVEKLLWDGASADLFTPGEFDLNEELIKFGWTWTAGDKLYLDLKAAGYKSEIAREALNLREVDPAAGPDSPLGNQSRYIDRDNNLKYNGLYLGSGPGSDEFPRNQASLSINWDLDRHSLELGLDYQDVSWRSTNSPPPGYLGEGYDESLPGGFAMPRVKRVFEPQAAPSETEATIVSIFAQDRFRLSDRWTLHLGLRVDDQRHRNDVGKTAAESTDLSPRLAAVWDLSGNGRQLLRATLGRYLQVIPQNLVNRHLSLLPNGFNSWTDFGWNPAAGLYNVPFSTVAPDSARIQPFDPNYKDEFTLGLDWTFASVWTASARLIIWKMDDLYWVNDQFDDQGLPFVAIRNYSQGERNYRGLQLGINHRLSDNLTVAANYTLSRLNGNIFPSGSLDEDTLFEGLDGVEEKTLRTDATSVNRRGPGSNDRTHNLNVTVVKHWQLNQNSVTLGTVLMMRSGEPWARIGATTLGHPESDFKATIASQTYLEPRGTRHLHHTFGLNLTGSWTVPVTDTFIARLQVEIANITDEQEQIAVNPFSGQPITGRASYQSPRELRLLLGIYF